MARLGRILLLVPLGVACASTDPDAFEEPHLGWFLTTPTLGLTLEETVVAIRRRAPEARRVQLRELKVFQIDVEPWLELDPEEVAHGRSGAGDGGTFAVVANTTCTARRELERYFGEGVSWYLLPRGRLAAYEHYGISDDCTYSLDFEPAVSELIPLERELHREVLRRFPPSAGDRVFYYLKGIAYARAGRPDDAESMLREGDEALIRVGGDGTRFRNRDAYGRRKDADLYDRAVAIARRRLVSDIAAVRRAGDPSEATPESSADVGRLEWERAELHRALPWLEGSLAGLEARHGPDSPELVDVLGRLARLHFVRGDYARSEAYAVRAVRIQKGASTPPPPGLMQALVLVYDAAWSRGDSARAEELAADVMALAETSTDEDDPAVVGSLLVRAHQLSNRGDHEEAKRLLSRALFASQRTGQYEQALAVRYVTARLAVEAGKIDEAYHSMKTIVRSMEGAYGGSHPFLIYSLSAAAMLAALNDDQFGYLNFAKRANQVVGNFVSMILEQGIEEDWTLTLEALDWQTFGAVFFALRFDSPPAHDLAMETVLARKGRMLERLRATLSNLRSAMNPEQRALLDELETARASLSALVLDPAVAGSSDSDRAAIRRLSQRVGELERQISAGDTRFRRYVTAPRLAEIQERMPPDGALVEFVGFQRFDAEIAGEKSFFDGWAGRYYAACVLRSKGHARCREIGRAEEVDQAIRNWLSEVADPLRRSRMRAREAGRALDEIIFEPLLDLLKGDRFLVLSPDGALNLVPFAALVAPDGSYRVESFTFSYVSTGRELLRDKPSERTASRSVLIGDPDYDRGETQPSPGEPESRSGVRQLETRFRRLPGTRMEVEALGRELPDALVLMGANATEGAVKALRSPRALHIATHGFLVEPKEDAPQFDLLRSGVRGHGPWAPLGEEAHPLLRMGLALAGSNRRGAPEDGLLTALEASGLDLEGTEIVVLSACETGTGEVMNGEGVYGLRRAFEIAGAASQLTSLWRVEDRATGELMTRLYRRLKRGEALAEALRAVQLETLEQEGRSPPFYWAAFVPSGAWGPVGLWSGVSNEAAASSPSH